MNTQALDDDSIIGVGIDAVEVERVRRILQRYDTDTLQLVFTPVEQAYARGSRQASKWLSVFLAVKEAVGKALGTGLAGIEWTEIEVQPVNRLVNVRLRGSAADVAAARGIRKWTVSWSSTSNCVLAWALAFGQPPAPQPSRRPYRRP